MMWERRLREMILAGGALTAIACGTQQGAPRAGSEGAGDATADDANAEGSSAGGDDGTVETSSGGDVTESDAADATLDETGSGSGGNSGSSSSGCCNTSPDPCCWYKYCEAATPGPACECSMDGGTWIPGQVDAASVCALPDGGDASNGADGPL